MRGMRAIVRDERGVAVVLGLVALLALTALVLVFLAVSAFEPQIAQNLTLGTQARYLAEAGVEAAFDGLAGVADWSTALAGATCDVGVAAPGTVASNALPGLTTASGTFTALVRNDCSLGNATTSADNLLTGLILDAGGANVDTNSRIIVVSTGVMNDAKGAPIASKTVRVVIKKIQLPTINGALAFPGLQADVNFSGGSFTIRGIDTNMDGTNGTGSPVLGISVGVATNEAGVDSALANNQQNSVTGTSQLVPGQTASGDNTAAFDATLTSQAVTDFVNAVKANADITIDSSPSNPFSITNIGSTCASDVNSTSCWGTTSHPKIVYVKGNPTDINTQFTALDIAGSSTGTGILIVEDGNVEISGNFNWNGPVIVTGNNVGVAYKGGGNQEIFGAVIVNELHSDGSSNLEGDIKGNAKISYSTEAISLVTDSFGRKFMSTYSWQEQ